MSDSDGDIGPQAPALPAAAKKRRVLDGETVLLEQVAFVTNFTIHPRSKSFVCSSHLQACTSGHLCTSRQSRTQRALLATSSSLAARCCCRRRLIAPCRASVTRTQDGIVKFWKKRPQEIEFIKKFFAHTGSVRDISVSSDGLWLATLGECARGALQYENRGVCLMNVSQARIRQSRSSMCLIST